MNNVKDSFLISVIVSTYNRHDALQLVLEGLAAQDDRHFEVIISDDGSDERTKAVIDSFRERAPQLKFEHCWQKHEGFRLAAVRNRGVRAAAGAYLIFLDGDCVPPPNFVSTHRRLASQKALVVGQRVLTNKELADQLVSGKRSISWSLQAFRKWQREGLVNRVTPLLHLEWPVFRRLFSFSPKSIRGCNFALWKSDYEEVNGCDENFVGWGHEDLDLAQRLFNNKVRILSGNFASFVLHLWHAPQSRQAAETNMEMAVSSKKNARVKANDLRKPNQ